MLNDAKTIDIKLEKLNKILQRVKDDEIDPNEFETMMSRHYSSGSWLSSLMLGFLIFSALIGLGSTIACCKNYLDRGRITESEDHVVYQRNIHTESDIDDPDVARIFLRGDAHREHPTRPSSRTQ